MGKNFSQGLIATELSCYAQDTDIIIKHFIKRIQHQIAKSAKN